MQATTPLGDSRSRFSIQHAHVGRTRAACETLGFRAHIRVVYPPINQRASFIYYRRRSGIIDQSRRRHYCRALVKLMPYDGDIMFYYVTAFDGFDSSLLSMRCCTFRRGHAMSRKITINRFRLVRLTKYFL